MFWRNVLPPSLGLKCVNPGICEVIKATYSKGGDVTEGVVTIRSKMSLTKGT
jgi:hypothetical protein